MAGAALVHVVDDDDAVRDSLTLLLESAGADFRAGDKHRDAKSAELQEIPSSHKIVHLWLLDRLCTVTVV